MRKPVVDYRKLRLSNITSPEYHHVLYLLGWVGYFCLYFLTENLIPYEKCHVMHCFLDDVIPFCEWFVLAYTFWYLLIVISLLWFILYDPQKFKELQGFIIVTQVVAMATYIIYPSCQALRPATSPREILLTSVMAAIYAFDTPTGVCPSLHVAYSMGIMSTWLKYKEAPVWWKVFVVIAVILISISTAFVKQHSVVDIFAAIPLSILAEAIIFGRSYWLPKFKKLREKRA